MKKGIVKRENKQRIGIKGYTREMHLVCMNDSYDNKIFFDQLKQVLPVLFVYLFIEICQKQFDWLRNL